MDGNDEHAAWAGRMTLSLTAHRGDDEPWRLWRLAQVVGLIPRDTLTKIDTIGDAKGCLYVTWKVRPTEGHRLMVERSWRALDEEIVEHITPAPVGASMVRSILDYSRGGQ